jgi:hypothetical protein
MRSSTTERRPELWTLTIPTHIRDYRYPPH